MPELRRRGDDTFRKHRDDRQPFVRRETLRGFKQELAVTHRGFRIAAARALRPSECLGTQLVGGHGLRQANACARTLDHKRPAIASHVPVQLIALKESQLTSGAVRDHVLVRSARQCQVRIADADAHAVGERFYLVLLGGAVSLHTQHFERNHHGCATPVFVARWKVAEDAALYLLTFDLNDDRFDDEQRAVRFDRNVARKVENAFLREAEAAEESE